MYRQPSARSCTDARAFLDAGIPLGGGTDAPFGDPDPWAAMRAASPDRVRAVPSSVPAKRSRLSAHWRSSPPGRATPAAYRVVFRRVRLADLCVLDQPWREARLALNATHVRATLLGGTFTYDRARPTA